ncbi:MAG: site-2 protease family protein [Candidatus Pacearchaeota archaeon]
MKDNFKNIKNLGNYTLKKIIFILLNIVFAIIISSILLTLKISYYYVYGIIAFLFSFLIMYYFRKNKKFSDKEDLIVNWLIILLMYFGVGSLFISSSFFINRINIIYAYDLTFLGIFCIFVSRFLWSHRNNLKKEGIMYLYRTKIGIKLIDYIGTKYKKTLSIISIIAIISGYILMILMIFFLYLLIRVYLFRPQVVQQIKVPPIFPLVPYVPEIFKISFLPPFYFTYWIIAIAVIAIFHEFSHGIIARRYGIPIRTTGFGFLGPFLAAFVEPDEKIMEKKPKIHQISVLAAGTFANIILTIIFFLIFLIFFSFAYHPAGVFFENYAYGIENVKTITMIGGMPVSNLNSTQLLNFINKNNITDNVFIDSSSKPINLTEITANGTKYLIPISNLKYMLSKNNEYIIMYLDLPAIRKGLDLKSVIIKIDDTKIKSRKDLSNILKNYKPNDTIKITTKINDEIKEYEITLVADPKQKDKPVLVEIGDDDIYNRKTTGNIVGSVLIKIFNIANLLKKPGVYYEPKVFPDLTFFIYNLLWWLILINLSVALMNMLPFTIFDGGRMFMLTIWGITKSEKIGKFVFKLITYLIIVAIVILMFGYMKAMFS